MENKRLRNLIVSALMLGSFLTGLNQTVLTSALPSIMHDFSVNADTAQWLTSIYMLVLGIMIPSTAYLISNFSTKKLYISAMLLFSIGCTISIFTKNFSLLVVSRVFQAMASGIIMQLVQVAMLNLYPKEERGAAMGMYGFVVGVAPAIGPTLAGYVIDNFGWRVLFYVLAFIAVLDMIFAHFTLKNITEIKKSKLEFISLILSTFGFGGLLTGVSNVGSYGILNPITYVPIVIGIISLILFTIRQYKVDVPLLNLRVFKSKQFVVSVILLMITYGAFTSATMILSLYIQSARKMSAMIPGLMMLPGSILMSILSPVSGRMLDKYGARIPVLSGFLCLGIGTFAFSNLSETTSILTLTIMYSFRMLGITFLLMPVTTWGLNSLKQSELADGSAISSTLRQVSGAIGASMLISIMTHVSNSSLNTSQVLADIKGMDAAFRIATILVVIGLIIAIIYVKDNKKKSKKTCNDNLALE
ncbi:MULTISPECIES: MDR family MFS transporter [unclassified Romboutsia]|uniref:MDR family MFS transporter n=1 Tax=unclassified Romboutsia TaxID=2626894 RepID=UPI00189B0312|nr:MULTISPECIES: MDR family MFS transporter [unclassified Romboutsia]MDB8805120.1 MDR family MFS transporter [Romboutsia sp. 1001216sp1]MDB8808717.1 MDR family MFS transporter [Romboutsia sp. 1001216sp1]MDB8810765.1 MDR family MFS transporter [Romboutsia sp. 1001216sp1]MDB8816485.1 MDR family MFS transporter [Romboutsia sp. 1001216sp1]MDB8820129.1 MDR family MFS transporter [Romboutsia sp. 1001216sp1]